MIIYIVFITIIVVGILYFISQPGNAYLAYADAPKPYLGKGVAPKPAPKPAPMPYLGKGVAPKPDPKPAPAPYLGKGVVAPTTPKPVPKPAPAKPVSKTDKKPLSDAAILSGLNTYGKNGKVSTSSNFFKDSTSGKFDYDKKTGKWFIKGSSGPSGSSSGAKGNFAVGSDKKPLSDAAILSGLNTYGKNGKVSTSSNFFKDSTSGKFEYDKKTGKWFIQGSSSGSSSGGNFAVGSDKKPLSDAAILSGLNTFGKNGKVSTSSNFFKDSTSGKYSYDAKTKTWSLKGTSSGSSNPQYALATLTKFSPDGNVSKDSSYYAAVQAGIYKFDDKTKSWYVNVGGTPGTSAGSSGSSNPQYALATLTKFAPDGNVSKNSSYYAAVQAGIYKYDDKTKSWYINTGAGGTGTGASAGTGTYTGGNITGYTGTLPNNPDAKTTVDQQALRNLNRMYGNGKIPLNSDYAGLVASGQVVWDPTNHAWMATTGSAVGYIGVGQAGQQDIRNLNRLFPDGNVTVGSRFANLVASGNVAWDPNNNTWVATTGKNTGYTGSNAAQPQVYVGTNADGSQYVTSGSGPVSGGTGYFAGVTVGGANTGYVDPNASAGYVDPNASAGYVDQSAGYVDQSAGYVDPNTGYSDPYAGYSDAGLW